VGTRRTDREAVDVSLLKQRIVCAETTAVDDALREPKRVEAKDVLARKGRQD
jgi:hypothetical protein